MMELYAYYRIPADMRATVTAEVAQRQRELADQWPGLVCRLLCRADESGDVLTIMETYHRAPPLQAAEYAAIEAAMASVPASRIGPRHAERFVLLAE